MTARAITLLDRRLLAAIRPVDPLGRAIDGLVDMAAPGARFLRKPDGTTILTSLAGLPDAEHSFHGLIAPAPATLSLVVTLRPASRSLLPRKAVLRLPRDPDPANATSVHSLFRAAEVQLPASTGFAVPGHCAAVVVRVIEQGSDMPVCGAVVRASLAGSAVVAAVGLTDRLGEAMLLLPGLPLATVGPGASVRDTHAVTIALFADPAEVQRARAALRAGDRPEPVDPDAIANDPDNAGDTADVVLRAGRITTATLEWTPP